MAEFTGERVVPAQVDVDLWNEHMARYAFAARFAAGNRTLDAACGSGYGSERLAAVARQVTGIDIGAEAVAFARERYRRPNLSFVQASCEALPIADASADLLVSFETIEHLPDWPAFLREARRVLQPAGQLIISTPNKRYYAEARSQTGPNPFHHHEFEYEEFAGELRRLFPHVSLYLENHADGIAFQAVDAASAGALGLERTEAHPAAANFFVAVCGASPPPPESFFYLPSAANVLRERERHIEKLDADVRTLTAEKQALVDMFRAQTAELERSNAWAADLEKELAGARARIVALQSELEQAHAGYQAKITECTRLLDRAEATVVERTEWAQRLDAELKEAQALVSRMQASRWVKLGEKMGVGPTRQR